MAIWGWVLTGSIIGFCRIESENNSEVDFLYAKTKRKNSKLNYKSDELSARNFLIASVTFTLGLILAYLALRPEFLWRSAAHSGNAQGLVRAMKTWPQSTERYVLTSKVLASSNLSNDALNAIRESVKFDKDFYNGWFVLYNSTTSSDEKIVALQNLKRLDPRNPKYKNI